MFRNAWDAQRFVEDIYVTPRLRRVEELLIAWGESETGYREEMGFHDRDATSRDARSSVQFMSTTEVVEERDRGRVVQEVEACVDGLPPTHAAVLRAIYANTAGRAVWERGVLAGKGREEVKDLCREAVTLLIPPLRRRGLGVE